MKRTDLRKITGVIAGIVLATGMFSGCGQSNEAGVKSSNTDTVIENSISANQENEAAIENTDSTDTGTDNTNTGTQETSELDLEVRFGDTGDPFLMHLYDNDTAAAIAGYVGTSDWRLPVYERDDNVDYSVLQYYDIPDRYEIPSNPVTVTSQKAGEVYYSAPNRMVLFYHDAKVEGAYTLIGYFDVTDEFTTAVEENPVLEGWENKILQIAQHTN